MLNFNSFSRHIVPTLEHWYVKDSTDVKKLSLIQPWLIHIVPNFHFLGKRSVVGHIADSNSFLNSIQACCDAAFDHLRYL